MVLTDLGLKITGALRKLGEKSVVDKEALDDLLRDLCNALLQADVNVKLVFQLRANIAKAVDLDSQAPGVNKKRLIQTTVFNELVSMLDPGVEPFRPKKGKPNVIMFVGLQGSGKTTTCTKLAYHYRRKNWKTGLVCADTFRAGAFDQLRQNAVKAKIPFYGNPGETDPIAVAEEGVRQFKEEQLEVIIVDTSGRHKQEADLFAEMEQLVQVIKPDDIIFVMDSSIGQAAADQAAAFKKSVPVGSVIITKLDGHAKGGGALSAVAATKAPVIFFGSGEHMDDLDVFSPKNFVRRLLGMGDVEALMNTVKEANIEPDFDKIKQWTSGQYTLRDMREQYEMIMSMGPINKMMQNLPGYDMLPKGSEKEATKKMRKYMHMMDSMTEDELNNPKIISASRQQRIARGSGCGVGEVKDMLEESQRIGKQMNMMKKMTGMKNGLDPRALQRNPNSLKELTKMVPPKALQQMGGVAGLQNMMKQMQNGDMSGMGGMMPGGFGM
jgi:signal recognition particle subunit SRP54